jgi:tRNA threonylcarbamoyladenosine biosynthesis protein TsaB
VALHSDGVLLKHLFTNDPFAHGEKMAVFVNELLEGAGISVIDLAAVAVSEGPGSYTGLRIGVSLAKGLCYASGIPLIAIDTLQSLAFAMKQSLPQPGENAILLPMIDARRMEVYLAGYDWTLNKVIETIPVILDEHFKDTLEPKFKYYTGGNGALKISESMGYPIEILPNIDFSALNIGPLAWEHFKAKNFVSVSDFEPVYLKEFAVVLKK